MLDEIKEAIAKKLPAEMSDTLRGELEDLAKLRGLEKEYKEKIGDHTNLNYARIKLEDKERSLALDSEALFNDRQKFEIAKRDDKIRMLEGKYQDVIKLMDAVFRNQRLVHRTLTTEDRSHTDENGVYRQDTNTFTKETDVVEE